MLKNHKNIIIIGAGPVGLTAALFLKKFRLPFTLIEKKETLTTHPSAHYLNMRTMEVLSEIKGIDQKIYQKTENIEYFRYYRYCRRLFEKDGLFAITDHFSPSIEKKYRDLKEFAFRSPVHLPQFHLVDLLYQELKEGINENQEIFFGKQFEDLKLHENKVEVFVKDLKENKRISLSSNYLFAADGFHSTIREKLKVKMEGFPKLQSFLNIFFESKRLASLIKSHKEFAMLHFIYNSEICAVLVNHSLEEGLFVLQIPINPPFDAETQKKSFFHLILASFSKEVGLKEEDFTIKNVGKWNLCAQIAENYYKNRCFLMGDSAHSFPPAGGFGMNTGIQDIHNLIHKLVPMLKNTDYYSESPFLDYSSERKQIGMANLNTAMKYYEKSIEIPRLLGLDIQKLRSFKGFIDKMSFFGENAQSFIFNSGVKIGSFPIEIRKFEHEKKILEDEKIKIPLIFVEEDVKFRYKNATYNQFQGKLCPMFKIKLPFPSKNTGFYTTSREIPEKILELQEEDQLKAVDSELNILKNPKNWKNLDFYVVFFRKNQELEEIRVFLKKLKNHEFYRFFLMKLTFLPEDEFSLVISLEKPENYTEILANERDSDKIMEIPSFFLMRSDGHLC